MGLAAAAVVFGFLIDPMAGSFLSLYRQKLAVKKQVDRHILRGAADDGLVLIKFTKEEARTLPRWEHPREFEFDGQMYDIVETEDHGDTIYYRCWWDKAETALNQRLRALAIRALGESPRFGREPGPLLPDIKPFCRTGSGGGTVARPGPAFEGPCPGTALYTPVVTPPPSPPPWAG